MPTTTTRGKFLRKKSHRESTPFRPLRPPDLVEVHLSEKFLLMSHGHHLFSFFPSAVGGSCSCPRVWSKKLQVATFPTYLSVFCMGVWDIYTHPFWGKHITSSILSNGFVVFFFVLSDHPDSDSMSDIETGSPWRCFSISSKRFISSSICPRLSRIVMLRPVGNSKDVRRSRRISTNSWLQNRHLTIVHGQHEISENLKALNFNYTIYLPKSISTFFSTKKDQKKLWLLLLAAQKTPWQRQSSPVPAVGASTWR